MGYKIIFAIYIPHIKKSILIIDFIFNPRIGRTKYGRMNRWMYAQVKLTTKVNQLSTCGVNKINIIFNE